MTIGGALSALNDLLNADDIPFFYKPAIKAVMETIELSSSEKPTIETTKNDLAVDCNNCKNNLHRGNGDTYCATGNGMCHYEYEKPTTKNDLAVDCRSLKDIKKLVERKSDELDGVMLDAGGVIIGLYFAIANDLPSVTPQPKTGHWIEEFNDLEGEVRFTCSCCGKYQLFGTDYCYNCGAKMFETKESEE